MWNFEHVFMPRVAVFDHNFSFLAYTTFRKFWADIYDFRTAIACKAKKTYKMQKHINYPHFNIYGGLHTVIVDIVIWNANVSNGGYWNSYSYGLNLIYTHFEKASIFIFYGTQCYVLGLQQ